MIAIDEHLTLNQAYLSGQDKREKMFLPIMRLRRHHDDEHWDEVVITDGVQRPLLHVNLVPRFKLSGLSGDEWRVRAHFELLGKEQQSFHSVNRALQYIPAFVWRLARDRLDDGPTRLVVSRKNRVLWSSEFATFGEAALGMSWHLIVTSESAMNWKRLTDHEERDLCQQPGCFAKPTRVYKYKRFQISRQEPHMADFGDFQPRHIWFCDRHAHRGDCGLEDTDSNYEIVKSGDAKTASVEEQDMSPSTFGGIIEIGLSKE